MIKGQSKFQSFIEANTNTFIGFFITLFVSPTIYRLVGMHYTYSQLWIVTAIFTIVSIIRGYVIRRWFNKKEQKQDAKLQQEIQFWKDVVDDMAKFKIGEKVQALALIHDYKMELQAEKKINQVFHQTITSQYIRLEAYASDNNMLQKTLDFQKNAYSSLNSKYALQSEELEDCTKAKHNWKHLALNSFSEKKLLQLELASAKFAFQSFVADAVESGAIGQEEYQTSNKSTLEDNGE